MNPWLAGLGAGLQSAGQSAMQLLAQEQQRREREAERKRLEKKEADMLTRQNRQQDEAFNLKAFELGLSPYESVAAPVARAETMGSALSSTRGLEIPGMGSALGLGLSGAGDALSELAGQARERMAKGRTFDRTDASGKTVKYYQPYERTKEGLEEAERTRGVQALVGAGYTDGEARAIMASPEKLQSAILERIRPTPKGQPQEIVQPDGSVTYVQVPVLQPGQKWDSGLKQRTPPAPGSTPYNWTLDTDDTTGQRVLVDPRTGQSRPVTTPGGDPMRNLPDLVKKRANAIATMEAALNRYEALVKQNGLEIMPGEGKSQLEAARTNLQIPWKTYAELGALSGPDMGLVIDAVGDATSINAVGAGDKGILAKIGEARIALNREKQLFTELYKFPIPGQGGAPQGAQLSPQEQAIYDAAKMEGKSDAEIMAFLQNMRGGGR